MDGPYAETRGQLGGILVLEARDMTQAVQAYDAESGSEVPFSRFDQRRA